MAKIAKYWTPLQVAQSGEFPWQEVASIHRIARKARPILDTAGNVVAPGDPDLAACFIRACGKRHGPLVVDVARLAQVVERRRLGAS